MNTYDYYSEARALAEELRSAGLPDRASGIIGAMEEGETGTEIFMIMRARLGHLLAEENMAPNLMERVRALFERLNSALS